MAASGLFAVGARPTQTVGTGLLTPWVPRNTIPGGTPAPAQHPMQVPAITTTNGIPNADSVNNASITANQQNSQYNNAMTHGNTTGPTGSQTFSSHIDPVTGATVYDQNIALPAAQQQVLNQQNQDKVGLSQTASGLLPQIASANSTPLTAQALQDRINMGGVTSQLFGANDLQGARKQVQDALYARQTAYLDPQYQADKSKLDAQLANQGIVQGSEAYNNAMNLFAQQRDSAYAGARNDAITGGLNEIEGLSGIASNNRAQQFGEATTDMSTHNNSITQQLANAMAVRADPLNRYKALTDAASVTIPQFNNPSIPLAQNTDVSGNAFRGYEDQLSAANQRAQNSNAVKSGLFGLAGDLITSGYGSKIWNGAKGLFGAGAPSAATTASSVAPVATDVSGAVNAPALSSNTFGSGSPSASSGAGGVAPVAGAGAAAAGSGLFGAGAGAGAGAGSIGVAESLGTEGLGSIGTLGGAGGGAAASGAGAVTAGSGSAVGAGGGTAAAGAGASGTGASAGLGSSIGAAAGIGVIAAAFANMIGSMTGRGDAASWAGPLPAGVTKTTTAGGQGAVQVGNMVFGLGSDSKKGGSINWFTKGADGKQKWVGADANNVMMQYAATGNVAPPGQGQKNAKGFNPEPGTREAMNAGEYTQAKMKGYYDKLGGQSGLGTSFDGWLQQLRSVGQGLRFYEGGQGNIF